MARENYNVFDEMYKRKNFTWSDAVKKGKILVISGSVATDENHRTLYKGDLVGRCGIFMRRSRVSWKAGASFDDVIKTTDYIAPEAVADYVKTADIRREYFKATTPQPPACRAQPAQA